MQLLGVRLPLENQRNCPSWEELAEETVPLHAVTDADKEAIP